MRVVIIYNDEGYYDDNQDVYIQKVLEANAVDITDEEYRLLVRHRHNIPNLVKKQEKFKFTHFYQFVICPVGVMEENDSKIFPSVSEMLEIAKETELKAAEEAEKKRLAAEKKKLDKQFKDEEAKKALYLKLKEEFEKE